MTEAEDRKKWQQVVALVHCADKLEHMDMLPGMVKEMRAAAFALHQELDPHCSCSDCLAAMEAQS